MAADVPAIVTAPKVEDLGKDNEEGVVFRDGGRLLVFS